MNTFRYFILIFYSLFFFAFGLSMESSWKKQEGNRYVFRESLNNTSLSKNRWKNAISGLQNLEASHHRTIEIEEKNEEIHIRVFESEREIDRPDTKTLLRTLVIKTHTSNTENNNDKRLVATCIGSLKDVICMANDTDSIPAAQRFKVLWAREILPVIKSQLARHIGQELAKIIIVRMNLKDFEPTNYDTLQQIKRRFHELEKQKSSMYLLLRIKKYKLSKYTSQSQDEAFIKDYETLLDITTAGAT